MSISHTAYDLLIIGGGIMGTFHAYHALQAGLKVALLERDQRPQGATVRNFGQIVPSGLDSSWQPLGRHSLQLYRQIQAEVDISLRAQGSVYLTSNEEEMTLVEELSAINRQNGYASQILTSAQCRERFPGLKASYCQGGLFFPEEINLDPRLAIHRILRFLAEQKGLAYFSGTLAVGIEDAKGACEVRAADGRQWRASQILICNGSDFKFLFPELFRRSDIQVVKIQMLQTVCQPTQRIPGSILTGRTIRRYESFRECPSFPGIKAREPKETPFVRHGIHILFKQAADGSVIVGDSHTYAPVAREDELGFDVEAEINDLILREAREILELESWKIQRVWFGKYGQHPAGIFQERVSERVHIVTGIGGKGMTVGPAFTRKNLVDLGMIARVAEF